MTLSAFARTLTGPVICLATCLTSTAMAATPASVPYAAGGVTVDGHADDAVWAQSGWKNLSHSMAGSLPDADDFSGRYKLAWDEQQLYLLVEITDDVLIDQHPDPKEAYWDDDCLEIFIDADASGGNHLHSFNAFAYHIALDGNVADFGNAANDNGVILLNDHLDSRWRRQTEAPHTIIWEVAVRIYPDTFTTAQPGEPLSLSADQVIGFMLAYCDNDGSATREHFMGSHAITPVNGDKNRGYIDASVFGKISLTR